jgi:hypothetical protein
VTKVKHVGLPCSSLNLIFIYIIPTDVLSSTKPACTLQANSCNE